VVTEHGSQTLHGCAIRRDVVVGDGVVEIAEPVFRIEIGRERRLRDQVAARCGDGAEE
jgi:hypothetical protein